VRAGDGADGVRAWGSAGSQGLFLLASVSQAASISLPRLWLSRRAFTLFVSRIHELLVSFPRWA